ncbi:MAG: hypothetical protein GWN62_15780 [Aliifodinibius sp.]|nr:hypothetical protein [Fodinibius sp.]
MDINLRALMYYIVTVIFISLVIGCAGSKQTTDEPRDVSQEDDYTEIERLLGITPEDKQQTSQESEDDDLLQLLQTSESSEGDVSTADTEQTDNQDVSQLEKEVEDLKAAIKREKQNYCGP